MPRAEHHMTCTECSHTIYPGQEIEKTEETRFVVQYRHMDCPDSMPGITSTPSNDKWVGTTQDEMGY